MFIVVKTKENKIIDKQIFKNIDNANIYMKDEFEHILCFNIDSEMYQQNRSIGNCNFKNYYSAYINDKSNTMWNIFKIN